jgi:hypothetical protein
VSAIWDVFVASVMTLLFGTMRIAMFCVFWLLLLMAVPTILSVL